MKTVEIALYISYTIHVHKAVWCYHPVASLGCLPPGADLKFADPRGSCLVSQNFFDDLLFSESCLFFAHLQLFRNPFLKFPPLKILFHSQTF